MNIIIPLGGIGKRFIDYGFEEPKPLIKALGKEIIFKVIESLKLKKNDKIYIIYNEILDQYNFQNYFINYTNIFLQKLNRITDGPVETISYIIESLENDTEPLLLVDGDTFYTVDILKKLRKKKYSTIVYSNTQNKEPIYSYIKTKNNTVFDIAEKKIISNKFNIGAYYFKNINIYKKFSKLVLNKNSKAYISDIYKEMIIKKNKIQSLRVNRKDFVCLGTPKQLINYCTKAKQEKKVFCFDLDNTLVTHPVIKNNYDSVLPIYSNIKILRYLKSKKHYIIIYTSRNINKFNSNIIKNKVEKDIKKLTKKQLKEFKIPYNELVFGKPHANFYIDNLAVNSLNNLNYKLGYYDSQDSESRIFNDVIVGEKFTIKKSTNKIKIKNEIKYLKTIPEKIKNFFPKIKSFGEDWYKMETLKGIKVSYLLENDLLKLKHIDLIFKYLTQFHNYKSKDINFKKYHKNYTEKFDIRIKLIDNILTKKYYKHISEIKNKLNKYLNKQHTQISVIHGDPIFSNMFLNNVDQIKFIDPRAGLLNEFTIFGDILYDYGKVYQSLYGYEFILSQKKPSKNLSELRNYFEKQFILKFGKDSLLDLKVISCSLYLTLIPLHKNKLSELFIKKSIAINKL